MQLSSFLQDNSGGFSATRLGFLLWTIGVLVVWIYTSIANKRLEPVDYSVTTILGILMTGKVVQRFGEQPDSGTGASPQNDKATNAVQAILPHQ